MAKNFANFCQGLQGKSGNFMGWAACQLKLQRADLNVGGHICVSESTAYTSNASMFRGLIKCSHMLFI